MLTEKMQAALNDQLREELYSAYLYLSMSAYCETRSLPGFASWMRIQYEEEMIHAFKFYDFIHDRNGRVLAPSPSANRPPSSESPLSVFDANPGPRTAHHRPHQ